jgi:hypothetical protein
MATSKVQKVLRSQKLKGLESPKRYCFFDNTGKQVEAYVMEFTYDNKLFKAWYYPKKKDQLFLGMPKDQYSGKSLQIKDMADYKKVYAIAREWAGKRSPWEVESINKWLAKKGAPQTQTELPLEQATAAK